MERRAQRIAAAALGEARAGASSGLPWSGTFHAIGARLLRMHASFAGLDPGFTIHDREDSADLLNLVRHELGLSGREKRFPLKATCLAIYSRVVNAAEPLDAVLRRHFP
jgi:DNA helicase-2/ATP-dependent DNA helicase PcrA